MQATEFATPFDIRSAKPMTTAVPTSAAASAIARSSADSGSRASSWRLRYV